MKSLKDYITTKYIENSYRNVILKQDDSVIKMFLDVGKSFGINENNNTTSKSSWLADDLYFYTQITSEGSKEIAYLDYCREKMRTIYTDKEGNLFMMNYITHKIEPTDISYIKDKDKKEKYLNYIANLKKDKENTGSDVNVKYTFFGILKDKKYYYGTDGKFYTNDSNMSKIEIKDDAEAKKYCNDMLTHLKKIAI